MKKEKNNLEIEKILKPYNDDIKRHMSLLKEDFERHVGVLAEDFKSKVEIIGEQYDDIKKTQSSHTEMIGSVKEDITIIKMDIEFIKGDLKKKVNYDEFSALEKRMSLVEAKLKRA